MGGGGLSGRCCAHGWRGGSACKISCCRKQRRAARCGRAPALCLKPAAAGRGLRACAHVLRPCNRACCSHARQRTRASLLACLCGPATAAGAAVSGRARHQACQVAEHGAEVDEVHGGPCLPVQRIQLLPRAAAGDAARQLRGRVLGGIEVPVDGAGWGGGGGAGDCAVAVAAAAATDTVFVAAGAVAAAAQSARQWLHVAGWHILASSIVRGALCSGRRMARPRVGGGRGTMPGVAAAAAAPGRKAEHSRLTGDAAVGLPVGAVGRRREV